MIENERAFINGQSIGWTKYQLTLRIRIRTRIRTRIRICTRIRIHYSIFMELDSFKIHSIENRDLKNGFMANFDELTFFARTKSSESFEKSLVANMQQ
jgi:hypothetical protein